MTEYLLDSIKKFKNDALSKGIYDIFKWLIRFLIGFVIINWIPILNNFLSTKYVISIYWSFIILILIIFFTTIIVSKFFKNRILQVQNDNYTDELTGLKNHKALKEYLNHKLEEFKDKSEALSVIIIDIDDFKNFNTTVGYNTADKILRKVGELLRNDSRATDATFRQFLRGDEFIVVASETNLNDAFLAAERKRKLIQKGLFSVDEETYRLTVSCGVTEFKKDSDDFTSLTDRVLLALNEAKKQNGKNCSKPII